MHPTILNLPLLLLLIHRAHSYVDPSCTTLTDYINACEVLTPSFTQLALPAQATCFCYDPLGNYAPDSFDQAALGCYEWALASATTLAADISSGGLVGLCTDAIAAAAPSSTVADVTRVGGGGATFATNSAAPTNVVIAPAGSNLNSPVATQTGATTRNNGQVGGGGGSVTRAPATTAGPAPTAAGNSPNPSPSQVAIRTSSEGTLWSIPTYLSAVAILISVLAFAWA
ncbi:hypothetical protein N7G274_002272 [Stereocaulon virgatum]|uniref:Extracellular membrane protein CFEM domain-containing protein n=1 Tax=Stereocaulon virgatum TaxID=373712 RepID=A0ABR4AID1_9LECA